jgi:hypothetical protein
VLRVTKRITSMICYGNELRVGRLGGFVIVRYLARSGSEVINIPPAIRCLLPLG